MNNRRLGLTDTMDSSDSLKFTTRIQYRLHEKDVSSFDKVETIGARLDWN